MTNFEADSYSEVELVAEFERLFPQGFSAPDVLRELAPVYRMIFRRLRSRGLDWVYHFPRLYAVDMRPLKAALDRKDEPEWTSYDPSEALATEAAEQERDKNLAELRESLDEGYREAIDESKNGPPPTTVRAYAAEYGGFPHG